MINVVCIVYVARCCRQHGIHGCNAGLDVRNYKHGNIGQTGWVWSTPTTKVCIVLALFSFNQNYSTCI